MATYLVYLDGRFVPPQTFKTAPVLRFSMGCGRCVAISQGNVVHVELRDSLFAKECVDV